VSTCLSGIRPFVHARGAALFLPVVGDPASTHQMPLAQWVSGTGALSDWLFPPSRLAGFELFAGINTTLCDSYDLAVFSSGFLTVHGLHVCAAVSKLAGVVGWLGLR